MLAVNRAPCLNAKAVRLPLLCVIGLQHFNQAPPFRVLLIFPSPVEVGPRFGLPREYTAIAGPILLEDYQLVEKLAQVGISLCTARLLMACFTFSCRA